MFSRFCCHSGCVQMPFLLGTSEAANSRDPVSLCSPLSGPHISKWCPLNKTRILLFFPTEISSLQQACIWSDTFLLGKLNSGSHTQITFSLSKSSQSFLRWLRHSSTINFTLETLRINILLRKIWEVLLWFGFEERLVQENVNLYPFHSMYIIIQGTYLNSSVMVQNYTIENGSNGTSGTHEKTK